MKEGNPVRHKSFHFAIRILKTCNALNQRTREYSLGRQLLRSGTSIGANIEEAIGGQSIRDFDSKMTIAYK